jgi:hypothetical protein
MQESGHEWPTLVTAPQTSKLVIPSPTLLAEEISERFDDAHPVSDDRGKCKGPPPDCRQIVIRLRYGVKDRRGRRATSAREGAWLAYTRIGP